MHFHAGGYGAAKRALESDYKFAIHQLTLKLRNLPEVDHETTGKVREEIEQLKAQQRAAIESLDRCLF